MQIISLEKKIEGILMIDFLRQILKSQLIVYCLYNLKIDNSAYSNPNHNQCNSITIKHSLFIIIVVKQNQFINNMFEGKKILDFYIRKKNYQKHIQKLKEISNKKSRDIFDDSMKQTFNQFKLKNKKFAFQERNREILEYNSKVFEKLVDISGRIPQHLVDLKDYRKKNHHNSYFIQKNQQKTINEQNSHIVKRILNQNSPLSKKQQQTFYQQTRKFKQRIQKFPYFSSIDRKLKSLVRRSSPEYTPRKKNERYNTQNFSINEDTFDD